MRKLWLDDIRYPPDSTWMWVKTVQEAQDEYVDVREISLDFDLGSEPGLRMLTWIWQTNQWPEAISVHSANNAAHQYMCDVITQSNMYTSRESYQHGEYDAIRFTRC
jgi:hypothetical protein